MNRHYADLISLLERRGVQAAAEIRQVLDISPATLSRLVREAEQVVRLGRGRATKYALRRHLTGLPQELPIYRVGSDGQVSEIGCLIPLAHGEHWMEANDLPGQYYEGLPPVIHDMSPQGFLGRRFSDQHEDLRLPRRLQDWNDNHRLLAVARRGEDMPGDLIFGEESLNRFLAMETEIISRDDYLIRAEKAAVGDVGSSAGGEQPKFTAYVEYKHIIVKYTPADDSRYAQRWNDLLACEAIALEVLGSAGYNVANTEIIDLGSQRFLEIERFDRVGERGRIGSITLGALDDELYGRRDNWSNAATRLNNDDLLSAIDKRTIQLLDAFGECIANGDRHFGNITFFADATQREPRLELAPAYDILPMDFAPTSAGLPSLTRPRPVAQARYLDVWETAQTLARKFWEQVVVDERISKLFRDTMKD